MDRVVSLSSGKGHRDENFPVASFLIRKKHRPLILAFYRFARAADDVADHSRASPAEKLHLLENMWRTLHGEAELSQESASLRVMLAQSDLPIVHALHLLEAFRRDVTKLRYENWDELMEYCRYSAMPVGRFVLDVHGEARSIWPASDALCAALQVINHLQDCGKDYLSLDRVYLPLDILKEHGVAVTALAGARASPALRIVLQSLAERASSLLEASRPFAGEIADARLGLEVRVIQRLAEDLIRRLHTRDPLSERVHHRAREVARLSCLAAVGFLARRRRASLSHVPFPQ
jgi:squalene synthase HpnC